jgi:hypothetical protein
VAALFDYSMKVHEVQKVQYWLRLLNKTTEMLNLAKEQKDTITVRELSSFLLSFFNLIILYLRLRRTLLRMVKN